MMYERLCDARPILERYGLVKPVSFGLNGLDRKLLQYINHRNGIFIEAGANDGRNQSNTLYFEQYLGWTGLLVEPVPELAIRCRSNRPKSIVEQYALVAAGDRRPNVEMIYCNLMSIVSGARGSQAADKNHIEQGQLHLSTNDKVRTLTVPTITLSELITRHNLTRIDLLSLDVEGFEGAALRGLDFDKLAPRWILVEANDSQEIESVIGDRYKLIAQLSHHDCLYRASV